LFFTMIAACLVIASCSCFVFYDAIQRLWGCKTFTFGEF